MILSRNRADGNPELAKSATVYLNGELVGRAMEAMTPNNDLNNLKGDGYVIRAAKPGEVGRIVIEGLGCVKEFGFVEVKFAKDERPRFGMHGG